MTVSKAAMPRIGVRLVKYFFMYKEIDWFTGLFGVLLKVQVYNKKFSDVCPTRMKLIVIKYPLRKHPSNLAANQMLTAGLDYVYLPLD